ncbi:MAG: Segregation and condensation protein A [Alphaproteobacteria bacterium MarineAlpha2_Bin1]|nr:MAG: Segregation and condensation protein A [Alphaproteobacteria bacterium MarineAlpha2_Bin1]
MINNLTENNASIENPISLVIDMEGYEGPLDVLLALARKQKVDLNKLSILTLADQYLAFIKKIKEKNIEIAADYLVMAAWLVYLKSKLLLPKEENNDELSGDELAARLQWQLRRLDSMREAAKKIMTRNRLGMDIFPRGFPDKIKFKKNSVFNLSLFDILKAYSDFNSRSKKKPYIKKRLFAHTMDDALKWLSTIIGSPVPKWELLVSFIPESIISNQDKKSAITATFSASLELVKDGKVVIQQDKEFSPIYIKNKLV